MAYKTIVLWPVSTRKGWGSGEVRDDRHGGGQARIIRVMFCPSAIPPFAWKFNNISIQCAVQPCKVIGVTF